MAAKDENKDEGQAGVAQGDEVVIISDGSPSTSSAAAPGVNMGTGAVDPDAEPLDPVYNQPASAFNPAVDGLDERSRDMVLDGMRATGVDMRAARLQETVRGRAAADAAHEQAKAVNKQVIKDNPLPDRDTETIVLDSATYKAREFARVQAHAATLRTSTTIPGGRFIVNGELVNAAGDRIDKNGKVLEKRS